MTRLRRMGRPSRFDLVLFVIAAALIVTGFFVLHGSPPVTRYYPSGTGRFKVVSQPTHAVDIIRTLMMIGGVAVALLALYRWGTRGERLADRSPDEERRHFGDSIMDARTNQDPGVGMRPVRTDAPRH